MTKLEIKGTIISNNQKWIYDLFEMDSTSPKDILLPENNEPLEVVINSGGGDVYAGSEIYTALRAYQGDVTVKIVGIAASAASVIAMAGNTIEISPTAQIMIHNVSSAAAGDHRTLAHEAEVLKNYNSSIANAYIAKTGIEEAKLLELMNHETWLTAEQAVENGFADKVMFENNEAPLLVASLSPVIPPDAIAKLAEKLKPQFDLDELANKVSEKLNTKKTESKEPENAGFKRFLF
ncbi:Clp protease ClpP [Enterococcus faecium]|uniref:head maturation protease, ClpP-related n=1 Tax=Enterococcus faecium TaxID=1352 RepID=UPI00280F14E8|nr:Clp protease ClpP [Enterococcus faecium]